MLKHPTYPFYKKKISEFKKEPLWFAKHGAAGLVLHYLGDDATKSEILRLKEQLESDSTKVVTIPGDIADPRTSQKVGLFKRWT